MPVSMIVPTPGSHTSSHTSSHPPHPQAWIGIVLVFMIVLTYWSLNEVRAGRLGLQLVDGWLIGCCGGEQGGGGGVPGGGGDARWTPQVATTSGPPQVVD